MQSPRISEDPKNLELKYEWCQVGVLDYDPEKKLYLVHKTDDYGLVRDEDGNPILNGGMTPQGVLWALSWTRPGLRQSHSPQPPGAIDPGLLSLLFSCCCLSPTSLRTRGPITERVQDGEISVLV